MVCVEKKEKRELRRHWESYLHMQRKTDGLVVNYKDSKLKEDY